MKKGFFNKKNILATAVIFSCVSFANYVAIIDESTDSYIFSKGETENGWSVWADDGIQFNCLSWLPNVSDSNFGLSFEQQQDCSQKQSRSRDIYKEISDGSKVYLRTETDNKTIIVKNKKNAVGTKDYITHQITGSWSSWANDGGVTGCSGYSPATSTVQTGQSFVQTRYCDQKQKRNQTVYDVWAKGSQTTNSVSTDNKTLTNVPQTRNAIGTKALSWEFYDYKSRLTRCTAGIGVTRPRGACSSLGATVVSCGIDYGAPGNNTYYAETTVRCQ